MNQAERKKILLISDDIRQSSGVSNVSRDIIINTAHHYNWVQMGGAINHPDLGKAFDISEDINKEAGITDASVKIIPVNGYGDPSILRQILDIEKPDALFIITDPRYFIWLFQIENEIRRKIPIIYYNIWDEYPAPLYNSSYYESCDALFGISKQTVNINKLVLGDKSENKIIKYIPHGIPTKYFRPIDEGDKDFAVFKKQLTGGKEYDFVMFFNSRNMRRKQIPDTLLAFKLFLDTLPKEKADKCLFILHTQPVDDNGTDLMAVIEYLFGAKNENVKISNQRLHPSQLNYFYNIADIQILLSSNEGWGLSLTEALVTGTPIIANVTGGMQDQMRFNDNEGRWLEFSAELPSNHNGTYGGCGEWAFPVFPSNKSMQGSPVTPYIWDSRCRAEDAADQILKAYEIGREGLKKLGKEGMDWALGDEAGFSAEIMGKRMIEGIDELFATWKPREKFEFINANEGYRERKYNHNLVY